MNEAENITKTSMFPYFLITLLLIIVLSLLIFSVHKLQDCFSQTSAFNFKRDLSESIWIIKTYMFHLNESDILAVIASMIEMNRNLVKKGRIWLMDLFGTCIA